MRSLIKKILNEGYWEDLYNSKRYTQKFEIGDRVIMNGSVGGKTLTNELGTVLKFKNTGGGTGHPHRVYLILFDNWSDKKHNFLMSPVQADQNREFTDHRCGDGRCWYTTSDNLEPAPDSSEIFNQLDESETDLGDGMPEINLCFDPPITRDRWDEVANVLHKLGVEWSNNISPLQYNPFDNESAHKVSLLTYMSWTRREGPVLSWDDSCKTYGEVSNLPIVDGWGWINRYIVDYDKTSDLFDQLNESEYDDFGWVEDLNEKNQINIGDVFYIVDHNTGGDYPMDYRPPSPRYVLSVYEIEELDTPIKEFTDSGELIIDEFLVRYTVCDSDNVTYDPKDYQYTSPKCKPIEPEKGGYNWILKLIELNYWRRM